MTNGRRAFAPDPKWIGDASRDAPDVPRSRRSQPGPGFEMALAIAAALNS
jgi:hypothetical protein